MFPDNEHIILRETQVLPQCANSSDSHASPWRSGEGEKRQRISSCQRSPALALLRVLMSFATFGLSKGSSVPEGLIQHTSVPNQELHLLLLFITKLVSNKEKCQTPRGMFI